MARTVPGIVVLVSGGGTNLQALIDAASKGQLGGSILAVISNKPGVGGLDRAARAGIETAVVNHRNYPERAAFDAALRETIDAYAPDLVVLAGFMRILTDSFVRHYRGRMLNIHPSLLPAYPGLHTHTRVLEAGDEEHGATVHFVTEELDGGPPVLQGRVPVLPTDTAETLAERVLGQEHRIYPQAVSWFCQGRLRLTASGAELDGTPLNEPMDIDSGAPS
ncbi:phosphoribosylglycinamide formyltransferase-1 [Halospina denitrificans]|uniref:Phosphoribosylglycinamide formyltransferase n=1 Tax=Halospina denitrificans TaxID=332522 RepID=A0A4R7JX85_9GAMM|nr:phosphoribosylglycinamide formyltransferase [Halospina denitrificans]TDT43072.1 phosphoribosylglycinamide formyltransferase-1 [Halospina denitrificans]